MAMSLPAHTPSLRVAGTTRCFSCGRQLQCSARPIEVVKASVSHPVPCSMSTQGRRVQTRAFSPWRIAVPAVLTAGLLVCDPAPAHANAAQFSQRPPVPAIAGLFSSQASIDADPVDPFTLYGTVFKKFLIENLDGDKVVSRKRGFTTTVCTAAIAGSEETPEMQFLPISEKVRLAGNQKCRKAETQDAEEGCALTCPTSCQAALDSYLVTYGQESGYILDEPAKQKLLASCTRRCNRECVKGGTVYNFVVNFRRY